MQQVSRTVISFPAQNLIATLPVKTINYVMLTV